MSQFKNKLEALRLTKPQHPQPEPNSIRHACSAQIKIRGHCSNSPRNEFANQTPIIICKKERKQDRTRKEIQPIREVKIESKKIVKKVEPFVPIDVPSSPRSKLDTKFKYLLDNTETSTPSNKKEIQIHIEKEMKDNKECLKKLFKKIHKLTEDLAESEKERIRLQLELNNLKNIDGVNRGNEKDLLRLEGQNYKLRSDIDFLKDLLKQRNDEIAGLKNKVPNQIIKEIVVEKPVEVRVEVPKYVPGPEKVVEVSKFVQNKTLERELETLRRKISDLEGELASQRRKYSQNPKIIRQKQQVEVPVVIEKPVYLDKPIYVDRPVYIDRPVQRQRLVEVPKEIAVEVPIQIPVYIEKPVVDQEMYLKLGEIERDMEVYMRENQELRYENMELKKMMAYMQSNLEILKRHNCQKNHQIETLLRNTSDYEPIHLQERIRRQIRISGGGNRNSRNAQKYPTFNPNL